jgi:hypothetical protein
MPRLNFDFVGYISAVESMKTSDIDLIHTRTLAVVKEIDAKHRDVFYEASYSRDLLSNPEHLSTNIPFYNIKILYVLLIRVLQRLTGAAVLSTVLPSVLAYLGIALLIWSAVGRQNALLAAALICQPVLVSAVRYSTPDLFGALWITCGAFFFMTGRKMPAILVLLVAVWVRPDSIVYVGFLLLAMLFDHAIDLKECVAYLALAAASFLAITRFGYPWSVLFYHSFVEKLSDPSGFHAYITPAAYLRQVAAAGVSMTVGYLAIYVLLAIVAWRTREGRLLVAPLAAGAMAHFLLYPSEEERLLLPFYLIAAIGAARSLAIVHFACETDARNAA